MKLQNVSYSIMSGDYAHIKNNNKESGLGIDKEGKSKSSNNQKATNVLMSPNKNFDNMIESIQEQITKIQENDHYDTETKRDKIEELEKQIKEIQELQHAQESEALKGNTKESKKSSNGVNTIVNADGDTLEIGLNTQSLAEAGINLDNLKNVYSMKKNLEGQSNILKLEIKTDKDRGLNTERKESQLSKLTEGIKRTADKLGESIKNANTSSKEQAERAVLTSEANSEKHTDGNDGTQKL